MKTITVVCAVLIICVSFQFGQDEEVLKLKEQIIELQNQGELGFQEFVLCSKILGYGSFVPLPRPTLGKEDTLIIYYEPLNIFTSRRGGLYEIFYTQDLRLMLGDGTLIKEWNNFLNFHYTAKKPVMDLYAQNSIPFEGQLPEGKYRIKAVLKDQLGDKIAEKEIEFEIQ